ncbi:MAG: ComEC/Rec2 family competence protein [Psychrobacter sp.]|nr:ComEC/Rec2 family competence protein [Psychrobacter sp.]
MYWLLSILILVLMIATLAITGNSELPPSSLPNAFTDFTIWPFLVVITVILWVINQWRTAPQDKISLQVDNKQTILSKSSFRYPASITLIFRILYYPLMILLTSLLIVGSGLQVLHSHSQAENTKITTSMRVQALVTIEGISDSVYDPDTESANNSGYRQVATISYIAPLVTELSAQDLDRLTFEQVLADSDQNNNDQNSNGQSNNSQDSNSQNNTASRPKHRILLSAYPKKSTTYSNLDALNTLQPGDQVLMSMSLAPLASSQDAINNPTGFDSYRWLRARHIDGVATVLSVSSPLGNTVKDTSTGIVDRTNSTTDTALNSLSSTDSYFKSLRTHIDQGRWQLRQSFYQGWSAFSPDQQQAYAVTLSLLTGDRSLINRETKDLYQLAGISHLLAISGTHVLFLAIIMAVLAVLIFDKYFPVLYRYIPRWQVRWGVMISAAFMYALFTGFDVPAARTAWMLLAIGAVRMTLLPVSTMRVLLALAVIMAWVDPYVLWQAGYWLSFVAVALILKYDASLTDKGSQGNTQSDLKVSQPQSSIHIKLTKARAMFKRLFKLQCWLFIALLPITLMLFGKASLWGLVINLFAIGLFGWVIVPLNLLAGLCYLIAPSIAKSLWTLVASLVGSLHELIIWLTDMPALSKAWLYTPVNSAILIMALLVLIPWLLPRGLLSRWLALPPLSLLIMTVYANQQAMVLTPTLYVLPTNDGYITAAVLQYPIDTFDNTTKQRNENKKELQSVSWLILADHRPKDTRTMASTLSSDKLAAILEQQLGTLAIRRLEGIVVQTDATLLYQTARQLSQSLPTNHYWQAGKIDTANDLDNGQTSISAQECIAGKTWQSADSQLKIQALTGWSTINDTSVWDCSLAIDSDQPIQVLQYNAADPLQSPVLISQHLTDANVSNANSMTSPIDVSPLANTKTVINQSRLVLDASTHQRLWQLWSLLCTADTSLVNASGAINSAENSSAAYFTTWLAHSGSNVPKTVLIAQQTQQVLSYDNKTLETAFALDDNADSNASKQGQALE